MMLSKVPRRLAFPLLTLVVLAVAGCDPEPDPPVPSVSKSAALAPVARPPIADPRDEMSVADADLAGRIESALDAETSLHGSRIGVTAANGVVTLSGSTLNSDLRSMASQIALSVDGVRLVRNELAVSMET